MAYYSGVMGANAPGNLVSILDTYLLENEHWTLYDENGTLPGANKITNGDFAAGNTGWTVGANWSTASGAAVHTPGSAAVLSQSQGAITAGVCYDYTFTVSGMTAGTLTVTIPTYCTGSSLVVSSDGTYNVRFICTGSGTGVLTFTPASAFDGALDDVSGYVNYTTSSHVYRCYDAAENCDFYVKVYDTYVGLGYASVQLWEGWNAGSHVGVGASLTAPGTATSLRMSVPLVGQSWGISVRDHCFIFQDYSNKVGTYVGQPIRYDTSKNIVIYCGWGNDQTAGNPLGMYGSVPATAWAALFDDTGATANIGMVAGNGGSNAGVKTIGGDVILRNTLIYSGTTSLIMGKLEGIASYGTGAIAGIVNAETVVINGVTWKACYNTNLSFFEMA
jgi:hypothetical protein